MRFLKDGTERVVHFTTPVANKDAVLLTEWDGADDHSGSIVKPLDINFADSSRFNFATIDVAGNGERKGKTAAGGTLRVVREYLDDGSKQIDPTKDLAFVAFGTPGTVVPIGVYRGPKLISEAMAVGDEYDYFEMQTDTPRVVSDDENYICYDIPLIFTGVSAAQKKLTAA